MTAKPQTKRPDLEDVMAFENSDVVYRFKKNYGVSTEESQDIFDQVKKFLWLGNEQRCEGITKGLTIDHPIVVIDEMWHNFVLFTHEYTNFCNKFFGHYIHHAPATEAEEAHYRAELKAFTDTQALIAFKKESKRPQYEYIYDRLGKETFQKWYADYPRRYSYRKLTEMQLKALDGLVLIEPPEENNAGGTAA